MWHAVERNAATDHVRVAAHAFPPEVLSHHGHIGGLFFFWQKIAAANRTHAENIEIVRGNLAAKKLNRIPQLGQCERNNVFAAEAVENRLAIPEMLKARHRDREFQQIALPGVRIHVHDTSRLFERQTAQEKIVDQAKDRSV